MKKLFVSALLALTSLAFGATTVPPSLVNPAGSTAGQAILSTGPSTAPAWGTVTLGGVSGTLAIANGGTGATSASAARTNLGLGSSAIVNTGTSGATVPLLNGANTWAAAQTFSVRPTFNSATPWDSANLNFASPPAIGGTTPAAGAFTTLSASSNPHVYATNTSAQSIPTGTATTVTGWTTQIDTGSNFNASTGVFTAPVAGIYLVSVQLAFNNVAWPAGSAIIAQPTKNGAGLAGAKWFNFSASAASTTQNPLTGFATVLINCAAGDTITVLATQTFGSAQPLAAGSNALSIVRIP